MASIRQIMANQLNAQLSTGPRTAAGKATVSMNALQSGIDAKSFLIRGESVDGFNQLKQAFYDRWQPSTPEQQTLVDSLIADEWFLRRCRKVESQIWNERMPREDSFRESSYLSRAFENGEAYFDRLARRLNSAAKNFHNALRDLERLKKQELAEAAAPSPAPIETPGPQLIDPAPTSPEIGFVPLAGSRPLAPGLASEPNQIGFVPSTLPAILQPHTERSLRGLPK